VPGSFALQAAIAALHGQAPSARETDWPQIVRLYDVLLQMDPSPVIALNRAVAVGMTEGAERALTIVDALTATGEIDRYHLLHAARGDFQYRTGRFAEAVASFECAHQLASNEQERRFLSKRIAEARARTGRQP
jgi:RNA polymerase sigma-70 factor (ECF subfamily)